MYMTTGQVFNFSGLCFPIYKVCVCGGGVLTGSGCCGSR